MAGEWTTSRTDMQVLMLGVARLLQARDGDDDKLLQELKRRALASPPVAVVKAPG